MVYTWVDTRDPEWLERREREFRAYAPADDQAIAPVDPGPGDLEELRYSIRSLVAAFPTFRALILVTDGQVPGWLRTDHPRVRVVEHAALFTEPPLLPTYNSQAIESSLAAIPGLSERFVYLNDDFFLDGPFRDADFFDESGRPRVPLGRGLSPRGRVRPTDAADTAAHRNANGILDRRYGRRLRLTVRHQPRPLTVSLLRDCEAAFPEAFQHTRACRFRSRRMVAIHNCLLPYWAAYRNRAVLDAPRLREKDMYAWSNRIEVCRNVRVRVERGRSRAFCIQGGSEPRSEQSATEFRSWMEERYPHPSFAERGSTPDTDPSRPSTGP